MICVRMCVFIGSVHRAFLCVLFAPVGLCLGSDGCCSCLRLPSCGVPMTDSKSSVSRTYTTTHREWCQHVQQEPLEECGGLGEEEDGDEEDSHHDL